MFRKPSIAQPAASTVAAAGSSQPQSVRFHPGIAPQLMPPGEEARRLSAYNFIDMYISKDPLAPVMARGLRSANLGVKSFTRGLVRIPQDLVDDAIALHQVVERKWRHTDYKREFSVVYDEMPYRCSLIAPPNFRLDRDMGDTPDYDSRWCIRQVRPSIPSFEELGLPSWAKNDFRSLLGMRGLVIISGPFASGKTTLASSALDYWVSESRDVGIALEDPPEIPLSRITDDRGVIYQIDLLDKSIREAIKNSRRWSPRYVFLGEVRTPEVAAEMMHMAISGPLVICTVHAEDPVKAIASIFQFTAGAMSEDMARDMIANSLRQVFHQEIDGGRVKLDTAKIHSTDTHLIKAKIRSGNFHGLYEDLERQLINRS